MMVCAYPSRLVGISICLMFMQAHHEDSADGQNLTWRMHNYCIAIDWQRVVIPLLLHISHAGVTYSLHRSFLRCT